jgi:hypothetical protein
MVPGVPENGTGERTAPTASGEKRVKDLILSMVAPAIPGRKRTRVVGSGLATNMGCGSENMAIENGDGLEDESLCRPRRLKAQDRVRNSQTRFLRQ